MGRKNTSIVYWQPGDLLDPVLWDRTDAHEIHKNRNRFSQADCVGQFSFTLFGKTRRGIPFFDLIVTWNLPSGLRISSAPF